MGCRLHPSLSLLLVKDPTKCPARSSSLRTFWKLQQQIRWVQHQGHQSLSSFPLGRPGPRSHSAQAQPPTSCEASHMHVGGPSPGMEATQDLGGGTKEGRDR